jgi:AraC-like DNA-binding protein
LVRDDPDEYVAFFRPPSLPGMEVIAADRSSRPWHMFHERYAFRLCRKTEAGLRYRGRDELVHDGTVVVREPGETDYTTFVAKPAEFRMLFVEPAVLAGAAPQFGLSARPHFSSASLGGDKEVFATLDRLCTAIELGNAGPAQQMLFAAFVVAVTRHAVPKRPPAEASKGKLAIERAKTHLSARFNESVNLKELATVAKLSRFHLVHAFTREVGMPPHTYQVHVRVERARRLLQQGMSPVEVAGYVGFADQSHLARHFKRIMRLTPSEYALHFVSATSLTSLGRRSGRTDCRGVFRRVSAPRAAVLLPGVP